jgi:hypothetical protein
MTLGNILNVALIFFSSDKFDGFKPLSIATMLYIRCLYMNVDATGLFATAVARALQVVGIFTGTPSSMEDKKSLDAALGKFILSG